MGKFNNKQAFGRLTITYQSNNFSQSEQTQTAMTNERTKQFTRDQLQARKTQA